MPLRCSPIYTVILYIGPRSPLHYLYLYLLLPVIYCLRLYVVRFVILHIPGYCRCYRNSRSGRCCLIPRRYYVHLPIPYPLLHCGLRYGVVCYIYRCWLRVYGLLVVTRTLHNFDIRGYVPVPCGRCCRLTYATFVGYSPRSHIHLHLPTPPTPRLRAPTLLFTRCSTLCSPDVLIPATLRSPVGIPLPDLPLLRFDPQPLFRLITWVVVGRICWFGLPVPVPAFG